MNLFDGDVILEVGARFLVRDLTTGLDLFALLYYPGDPNGALDEPVGSIASGAAGTWRSTGAFTWVSLGGGASGVDVEDEGVPQGVATILNFVGGGVSAAVALGTATLTIPGGVAVKDEGVPGGQVLTIDFVGPGVSVAVVGDAATVTVPGGGGGGVIETFVYTETGVADIPNGIYDDWATLITATSVVTALGRQVRIMLWGDVTTLPAGLWAFDNVEEWTCQLGAGGGRLSVTLADGFRLSALPNKITGLQLIFENTVDPVWSGTVFNSGFCLILNETELASNNTPVQPFIRLTGISSNRIKTYGSGGNGYAINNSNGPGGEIIDLSVAGASLEVDMFDKLGVAQESIKGVVGSTFVMYYTNVSGQVPRPSQNYTTAQFPAFLGTLSFIRGYNGPGLSAATALAANTPSAVSLNDGFVGAWVFGDVNLAGDGVAGASIVWQVETGPGLGVYTPVQTLAVAATDTTVRRVGFGFFAPTGRRWQWVPGALGAGTETVNNFRISEW